MSLIYLAATGKTVTCTVSLNGGATSSPTVTESSGVYTAAYTNASTGILTVFWSNTTDSTEHRETLYWDGSDVRYLMTAQEVRDAVDIDSTAGRKGLSAQITNAGTISSRR